MSRLRRDDGVSIIEFALVLPLLVVVTIGMFTGGLVFHTLLSLDHAAREGARYGATLQVATNGDDTQDWSGYLNAVATQTVEAAIGELNADDPGASVCVAWVSADGSEVHNVSGSSVPCFDDSRGEDRVQVLVRRDAVIEAVFFRVPVPLQSTALARYERG